MLTDHLRSFPQGFRALVLGASGGIGSAYVQHLQADPRCALMVGLGRSTLPPIDFEHEATVSEAAAALAPRGPFHLVIVATGMLHGPEGMP